MVRSTQANVLEPDETYLTAMQVVRKYGSFRSGRPTFVLEPRKHWVNPPGLEIPGQSIWGVTERRMIIWSTERWNRRLREPIASLRYGEDIRWVRVAPKSDVPNAPAGKTYVHFGVRGRDIETEIAVLSIPDLVRAVDGRLPPAPPN